MIRKAVLIALTGVFLISGSAFGQMDYSKQKFGVGLDLGIGFTSGLDAAEELGLNADVESSTGAVLKFGVISRIKIVQGFYVKPFFNFAFYGESLDMSGFSVQTPQGNVPLQEIEWNTTHISFGVIPTYYLRFRDAPIHPFGGLGIKLHSHSFGSPKLIYQGGETELESDSKFGFGISPTIGAEYVMPGNMAIPLYLAFDLIFSDNVSNVFTIGTGFIKYF
jgi:hypothetical protein